MLNSNVYFSLFVENVIREMQVSVFFEANNRMSLNNNTTLLLSYDHKFKEQLSKIRKCMSYQTLFSFAA